MELLVLGGRIVRSVGFGVWIRFFSSKGYVWCSRFCGVWFDKVVLCFREVWSVIGIYCCVFIYREIGV